MSSAPVISVVIATRCRPQELRECLKSLAGQLLPRAEWEVIVVEDGGPPDETLAGAFPEMAVRSLRQVHGGCGKARNTGVEAARGKYAAFTDDDCVLPPDWLSKLAAYADGSGGRLIAGRPVNALRDNPYSEATQQVIDYLLARSNPDPDCATLAIGCNFAVPVEGFRRLGGFDPRFHRKAAEERDFCARWLADGRGILHAPELIVYHAHKLTFASFLWQHFHYGRGARVYHRLETARRGGRSSLEKPSFYAGLLARPWKTERGLRAARLGALLFASQMAHTAGFVREMLD